MSITECDALREEVAMLEAENRRLQEQLIELRKVPAYPEKAVRAVWEHGYEFATGWVDDWQWGHNQAEVGRIFVEAMRDA